MAKKVIPDFVIATSAHYTGFHSTNLKHAVHGAAQRSVEDCVKHIREYWPGATITSDSALDKIENRREYTKKDVIYSNKIRTRLQYLENKQKLLLTNKKLNDTLSR